MHISLKKIFRLWIEELKRIIHNPAALILFVAILILPSLYAWVNIRALWDPYNNTNDLKIAVTTNDQTVKVLGKSVNVGDQILGGLRKNHRLNWQFLSSQAEVKRGVRSGKYYAGIVLPKNFSADLLSITTGKIKKPDIIYLVNGKINPVAPKVTEVGVTGVERQIKENFTKEVASTLLRAFHRIGYKVKENQISLEKAKNLLLYTDEHLPEIDQTVKDLEQLKIKIPEIDQKIKTVVDMEEYLPEVDKIGKKVVKLNDMMPDLVRKASLIDTVYLKLPEIKKAAKNLSKLDSNMDEIARIMQEDLHQLNYIHGFIISAEQELPTIEKMEKEASQTIVFGLDAERKVENVLPQITQLMIVNWSTLQQGMANLTTEVSALPNVWNQAAIDQIKLMLNIQLTLTTQFESLLQSLVNLDPNNISLQLFLAQDQAIKLTLQDVIQQVNALTPGNYTSAINDFKAEIATINAQIQSVDANQITGLLKETLEKTKQFLTDGQGLLTKLQAINLTQLFNQGQVTVEATQALLHKYQAQFPEIRRMVHDANILVNANMEGFINGLTSIDFLYHKKLPTIQEKIAQVAYFYQYQWPKILPEFRNTITLANQRWPKVRTAIELGANFVKDDWPDLRKGIQTAAKAIRKGDEELNLGTALSIMKEDIAKQSDFLAKPIGVKTITDYKEPNYGSQNTPFYTVLSLWVGALLFSSLATTKYPLREGQLANIRETHGARMLTYLFVGLSQALIVVLGDLFLLKTYVKEPVAEIFFAMFISFSFMSLIYLLVSLFDNIGKGVAIVILVFSIAAGGGNFPIELLGNFFKWLHPFLPFTYGVKLLRESTGGIYLPTVMISVIILASVSIISIVLSFLFVPEMRKIMEKFADKTEEAGVFH